MKNYILLILCLLCVWTNARAEAPERRGTDAHIFGHVLDKATQEHIPYATVYLKGTTVGLSTDATGHYFMRNLPIGKFTIEVVMIGYKTVSQESRSKKTSGNQLRVGRGEHFAGRVW